MAAVLTLLFEKHTSIKRIKRMAGFIAFLILPLLPYFFWLSQQSSALGTLDLKMGLLAFGTRPWEELKDLAGIKIFLHNLGGAAFNLIRADIFIIPTCLLLVFYRKSILIKKSFLYFSFIISICLFFWIGLDAGLVRYIVPFSLVFILVSAQVLSGYIEQDRKEKSLFLTAVFFVLGFRLLTAPHNNFLFNSSFYSLIILMGFSALLIWYILVKYIQNGILIGGLLVATMANIFSSADLPTITSGKGLDHYDVKPVSAFLSDIKKTTGWSYQQFSEHSFIVGLVPWIDFSLLYNSLSSDEENIKKLPIDGVFVVSENTVQVFDPGQDGLLKLNLKSLGGALPRDYSQALVSSEISCVKLVRVGGFQICYYQQRHNLRWNNIGYAYQFSPLPLFKVKNSSGVVSANNNVGVFYLNYCEALTQDCTIFFQVEIQKNKEIRVQVSGDPVGAPDDGANSALIMSLTDVALEVFCANQVKTHFLTDSLGFNSERKNFLAPHDKLITISCDDPEKIILKGRGFAIRRNFNKLGEKLFAISWIR